jgi:glucosamine--fructose-6-phosphate aminotransferase (isomerizing)
LLKNSLISYKSKGKVKDLEKEFNKKPISSFVGIGHTRWATHGEPNKTNAHPHLSNSKNLAVVHNGIIENYYSIRKLLKKKGYEFYSDTDTEVLINLIEYEQKSENLDLFESVRSALKQVIGAYAIVVMQKDNFNEIVVARKGSPLVIGIENGEYYVASDTSPILEYTKNVVYLNDDEVARINIKSGLQIKTVSNKRVTPFVQELALSIEDIEKGCFDYFMLKEIYEQPKSIKSTLRGRITAQNKIKLSGIRDFEKKNFKSE